MDDAAESGRNSVSKHRFSLIVENDQDGAGRYSQICLARLDYQARTDTGKQSFSLFI